jgi:DNA-binding transcriptional ArsR family regulator
MMINPNIKAQELTDAIGLTKRSVEYAIRALKKAGIVARQGADKGGRWAVKLENACIENAFHRRNAPAQRRGASDFGMSGGERAAAPRQYSVSKRP